MGMNYFLAVQDIIIDAISSPIEAEEDSGWKTGLTMAISEWRRQRKEWRRVWYAITAATGVCAILAFTVWQKEFRREIALVRYDLVFNNKMAWFTTTCCLMNKRVLEMTACEIMPHQNICLCTSRKCVFWIFFTVRNMFATWFWRRHS